jgi:hypothetical protein
MNIAVSYCEYSEYYYAWDSDNWEPGMPIGYGKTKEDAIQDLKIQIEDHENNI